MQDAARDAVCSSLLDAAAPCVVGASVPGSYGIAQQLVTFRREGVPPWGQGGRGPGREATVLHAGLCTATGGHHLAGAACLLPYCPFKRTRRCGVWS